MAGHLIKRDQISLDQRNEGGLIMDKKTFRMLTEIEREMRIENWSFKTIEASSPVASNKSNKSYKRNEELEELRMRNSIMSDDLQYKSQLLSEKIQEMNDLTMETERLRAENNRLMNYINLRKDYIQEKVRMANERDSILKEDLEKEKIRAKSLEKQVEGLRAEIMEKEEEVSRL